MDQDLERTDWGIDRRTVLRTMAGASAMGVIGIPTLSGGAVAQSSALPYRFYTVHPFNNIKKLVAFDPIADGSGTIAATKIADLTYEGEAPDFGCFTIAFHPNGDLYGISSKSGLFKIDTDTGEITFVNADVPVTGASAFSYDEGTLYLYYLNPTEDKLARIKPDGTGLTEFDLTLDDSFNDSTTTWEGSSVSEYYGDYNAGMAVDFNTKDLFAIVASIQDPPKPDGKDDKVKIGKDGTVTLIQKDVIEESRKVGDEIDPCTGTITAIRAGDDLYELEDGADTATKIGDVKLGDTNLDVASLASPWQIEDCGDVCQESELDICAGQDTNVGTVTVSEVDDTLEITYEMDPESGWLLYETHAHVGCDMDDFPLTKSDNPKVGQFDYSESHEGVSSFKYEGIPIPNCDEVFIATHAVVSPCESYANLFGTAQNSGDLYEIDALSGTATSIYSWPDGDPADNINSPNGLAYDPENARLYFTVESTDGDSDLYFWDGTDVNGPVGTLSGIVVGATFYDGEFLFIQNGTDDLMAASFDGDGNLDTVTPVCEDITGGDGQLRFGDMVVDQSGTLYASTNNGTFFSVDLDTCEYSLIAESGAVKMQLAYGSNGQLYATSTAGDDDQGFVTGEFFEVDVTDGSVTSLGVITGDGDGFTDLASGELCTIDETAWTCQFDAAGVEIGGVDRFTTRGNWATYFTYEPCGTSED